MAMIFRSHYALINQPMTTQSGIPTSAVFGSAKFIIKLIREYHPDYLVFATDTSSSTFRKSLYPEYKANRKTAPTDLQQQIPLVYDLIKCFNLPLLKQDGIEADDIIGSVVKNNSNINSVIVSGDKDFYQLVDSNVKCLLMKKNNNYKQLDPNGVKEHFGVMPSRVIDALAMIGDTADNVPGVAGIGKKGAISLLEKYDNLDNIYNNLDKITNKRQYNGLINNKEMAYLSKKLVTIDTNVDIDFDISLSEVSLSTTRNTELISFFNKYEFNSLIY